VAATETSEVVVNREEIIDVALTVLLLTDLFSQVEAFNRVIDQHIDLVSEASCTTKALQVDNDNVRTRPDFQCLGGLAELFASVAIPCIVFGKLLALSSLHEAIFESDAVLFAHLATVTLLISRRIMNERQTLAILLRQPATAEIVIIMLIATKDALNGLRVPVENNALTKLEVVDLAILSIVPIDRTLGQWRVCSCASMSLLQVSLSLLAQLLFLRFDKFVALELIFLLVAAIASRGIVLELSSGESSVEICTAVSSSSSLSSSSMLAGEEPSLVLPSVLELVEGRLEATLTRELILRALFSSKPEVPVQNMFSPPLA
jgi:hypothetical protein